MPCSFSTISLPMGAAVWSRTSFSRWALMVTDKVISCGMLVSDPRAIGALGGSCCRSVALCPGGHVGGVGEGALVERHDAVASDLLHVELLRLGCRGFGEDPDLQ